jgi:hypothetical protein
MSIQRDLGRDFGYDYLTFSHGDFIMAVLMRKDKPFARRELGVISK